MLTVLTQMAASRFGYRGRDTIVGGRDWPKNPRALAGRLRRAQTSLRALGIEVAFSCEGRAGSRVISIHASPGYTVSTVSVGNGAQFCASHNRDGRLHPIADGADAKSPTTSHRAG